MQQIDDKFFEEVGLSDMPADQKTAFAEHLMHELEDRIGSKIAENLSEQQLDEFDKISETDVESAKNWFANNYPNYTDLVSAEFNNIKSEVLANRGQILA
jgi:tRNA uridine 5-carbamoylmethylation protein Kti12